jgi:hypothetical protein
VWLKRLPELQDTLVDTDPDAVLEVAEAWSLRRVNKRWL